MGLQPVEPTNARPYWCKSILNATERGQQESILRQALRAQTLQERILGVWGAGSAQQWDATLGLCTVEGVFPQDTPRCKGRHGDLPRQHFNPLIKAMVC